ncbi:hypothetical protein BKP42_33200 [Rhodococcus erythropolis]|nr:hypothetical protein BKP42_33200 [Rhodococcus erythropolis]
MGDNDEVVLENSRADERTCSSVLGAYGAL